MSRRILVVGADGQLGTALAGQAWPDDVAVDLAMLVDLDITDAAAVAARFAGADYGAVINAAAYTAVDRAESDVGPAWLVNAVGPALLAKECRALGIPLIHVSTDYVFPGDGTGYLSEDDATGPIGVYGASKLAGEIAVTSGNPRSVVVRTAWLVSPFGANFVKTMLRVGAERPELRVVDDQVGCPTGADDLAGALRVIALRQLEDAAAPCGVYHFVNEGETSWCGLAREIFALAAPRGGPSPQVTAITTADYPTPARRPANSRLSTAKIARDYGVQPRPWQAAMADIVAALLPAKEIAA